MAVAVALTVVMVMVMVMVMVASMGSVAVLLCERSLTLRQARHKRLQRRRAQRQAHARQLRLVPHRGVRRAVSRRPGRVPQDVLDRVTLPARGSTGEVGGAEKVPRTYKEVRGGVVCHERGDCGSLEGDVSVQGGGVSGDATA
jgi:hypothetical protein